MFLGHATRLDVLFDTDLTIIGRATIPTFLMVSGYFTAMNFAHGGRFFKKIAKHYFTMWVIFVPASVLVLGMDFYLIAVDSVITERDKFDPDMSLSRIVVDVFYMLTFSGEYWAPTTFGQGVFSNETFWTMDYIMGYTVATAAFYVLSGWKRVIGLLIIAAIVGPTIILLSPLWFAGVLAYEIHKRCLFRDGVTSVNHLVTLLHDRFRITTSKTSIRRIALVMVLCVSLLGLI